MDVHPFYMDKELGYDWRGQCFCVTCGMPKRHPFHDLPERPPEDVSERILGEGQTVEEA